MMRDFFKSTNLCVVGNINRDIKTSPFAADAGLFADGETSVASISETIGGGGANSAAAAAKLGAKVAMFGKIGADALGDRLTLTLQRMGIDVRLTRDPACATGTSLGLTFTNGSRHFVSSLPNNAAFTDADVDVSAFAGYTHLLRADIWFSEPLLFGGNARIFKAAREAGLATSIDLNWDPCWGHADSATIQKRLQAVRDVLPLVTLAHGNVRELNTFAQSMDLMESLKRLTDWGVGGVVVHLGAQGAGFYQRGTWIVEPPAPVARMTQTTGTGDLLSVCMMLLSQHRDIAVQEQLHIANGIVAEFIDGRRVMLPGIC